MSKQISTLVGPLLRGVALCAATLVLLLANGAWAGSPIVLPDEHHRSAPSIWHMLYQPKVDVRSGSTTGHEALFRVNPDRPASLRRHLLRQLNMYREILNAAMEEYAPFARQGFELGVNITYGDLTDPTLPDAVEKIAARHELPHDRLTLEIVEGTGELTAAHPMVSGNLRRLTEGLELDLAVDDVTQQCHGLEEHGLCALARYVRTYKIAGPPDSVGHAATAAAIEGMLKELGLGVSDMTLVLEGVPLRMAQQLLELNTGLAAWKNVLVQGYPSGYPVRIGEVNSQLQASGYYWPGLNQ